MWCTNAIVRFRQKMPKKCSHVVTVALLPSSQNYQAQRIYGQVEVKYLSLIPGCRPYRQFASLYKHKDTGSSRTGSELAKKR